MHICILIIFAPSPSIHFPSRHPLPFLLSILSNISLRPISVAHMHMGVRPPVDHGTVQGDVF